MPLLTSPIDGSPMKQIHRFGIELDVCPTSGGVWLDKGELEKLIQFIKESAEQDASHFEAARNSGSREDDGYYRRDPHQRYSEEDYKKGRHKEKSGMHRLMDLFDL